MNATSSPEKRETRVATQPDLLFPRWTAPILAVLVIPQDYRSLTTLHGTLVPGAVYTLQEVP